jgi:hypothetical protein
MPIGVLQDKATDLILLQYVFIWIYTYYGHERGIGCAEFNAEQKEGKITT